MKNQVIRHNEEAEEALIACLIYDKEAQEEFLPQINTNLFYGKLTKEACELMKTLSSEGKIVDIATVMGAGSPDFQIYFPLKAEQRRSELGYITTNQVKQYLEIVKTDAFIRDLSLSLEKAMDKLETASFRDVGEVVSLAKSVGESFEDSLSPTGVVKKPKELAESFFERISKAKIDFENGVRGATIPTGFTHLDAIIGGLKPAQLMVVGAQPGMGKTAFALNIAENIAFRKENKRVLFFSLEMTEEQLVNRIACVHLQVDSRAMEEPHLIPESKLDALGETAQKISQSLFYLYDDGSSDAEYILSVIRKAIKNDKIDVVIIDYLQLIEGERGKKQENRVYELTKITRALKNITREFRIPIILLSQLNRDIEKRAVKVPQLSDLRDSGSIEQDADIVMFINRNFADEGECREEDLKLNEARFHIKKHRSGKRTSFKLGFIEHYTRFENIPN